MLSNRDVEIINFLLLDEQPVSIKTLANEFKVSERSIRYYLDSLNVIFKGRIKLDKGFYILQERAYFLDYLQNNSPSFYSVELKKKIVFYHIIFYRYINLTGLSETLNISRSSSKSYLEDIKKELHKVHLEVKLEHRKGLILNGREEDIRNLQLKTLMSHDGLNKTNRDVLQGIVDEYLSSVNMESIKSFIAQLQKEFHTVFSDYSYRLIKIYLSIVIREVLLMNRLSAMPDDSFILSCPEYDIIEDYLKEIESVHQIQLEKNELLNITNFIIGSHYASIDSQHGSNWFEFDLLISKMINLFSEYIHLNLNQDRQLYHSLLTHLKPTMYRLLHNIKMNDIDDEIIIKKYPKEYEITKKILNELHFFTGNEDSDEIALLTIHFKAAINRVNTSSSIKRKVLIVCSHGYGTSKLLEQQLLDSFDVKVYDCIPSHYLNDYPLIDEIDCIITTVTDLNSHLQLPILHVHPILNEKDLATLELNFQHRYKKKIHFHELRELISDCCDGVDEEKLETQLKAFFSDSLILDDPKALGVLKFLPIENIIIRDCVNDWKSAIIESSQVLVDHGYVEQTYATSVLTSFENYGSYMIIDEGIAIPHAKNEQNVSKTGMSLLLIKDPVEFLNKKKIFMFFTFCSKDNTEHMDALLTIANLIKETDFKEKSLTFQSPTQIYEYIKSYVELQ